MTSPLVKAALIAILALVGGVVLIVGDSVLIPLAIALLVWMFINALARQFQRLWSARFGPLRPLSLGLAFLAMLVTTVIVVNIIIANFAAIGERAPDFERSINTLVDRLATFSGLPGEKIVDAIVSKYNVDQLLGSIVVGVSSLGSDLGVVFVYVMFMLVEQTFFDVKLKALIADPARRQRVRGMLDSIGHGVQGYLWTMTIASLITAGLSYLALVLIGVDSAPFWAFLIFVLNYIPTFGSILGTAIPSLFALLQFGDFRPFLIVAAAIGLIQFVVGNIILPRMTAKSLNVSQLVVILALFVWGAIWGIVGMFLAVPITAVALVICSNFPSTRGVAVMLSESGDFDLAELDSETETPPSSPT